MGKTLRIHDGTRTAEQYRALREDISSALQADAARIRAGGEQNLDRGALRACFDRNGFAGQYFGLDFDAPLAEFLPALQHVHEDVLVDWEMLIETYPTGVIDTDDMVALESSAAPDTFGPED